jgi:ABC-type Fe3+/spermidine/putrescine transport system ATPase subunit
LTVALGRRPDGDAAVAPPRIELRAVSRRMNVAFEFGPVSIDVAPGDFVCLLGPSGSGKSTLLGIVGGWFAADSGDILFDGVRVNSTPTHLRPIRACFQKGGYLFPHMSVAENVGYSLQIRKVPAPRIRERVALLLDVLRLDGMAERRIASLSGGEMQRVAIARALADPQPILLLDEIQIGLDAQLRASIRDLVVDIHRGTGATIFFVTHDAQEAMELASRRRSHIAVMEQGQVVQLGTAEETYKRPQTAFVARLTGAANLLEIRQVSNGMVETVGGTTLPVDIAPDGEARWISIRPEDVRIGPNKPDRGISGTVVRSDFLGSRTRVWVQVNSDLLAVEVGAGGQLLPDGASVTIDVSGDAVRPVRG